MLQQKKFGGCLLFLSYLFRNLRGGVIGGAIHIIFTEIFAFHLIYFFIGVVIVIGWDWQLLILVPLGFILGLCLESLSTSLSNVTVYAEVRGVLTKFNLCKFVPIPVSEFVKYLGSHTVVSEENKFFNSRLSDSEYFRGNQIRIIVIDSENSDGPSLETAVAFSSIEGSWVFLNDFPSEMTGFQKFTVLHEIGHTEGFGNLSSDYKRTNLKFFIIIPIVLIIVVWNLTTLISVLILLLLILLNYLRNKWFKKYVRFYEEVYADCFAFIRADKKWFRDFAAEQIAENLCKPEEPQSISKISRLDNVMTEQQIQARKEIFANNVKRLREGEIISNNDLLGQFPFRKFSAFNVFFNVGIAGTVFFLGLQSTKLSIPQLLIFSLIAIVSIITLALLSALPKYFANIIDFELRYKKTESFSKDELKNIEKFYKNQNYLQEKKSKIQESFSSHKSNSPNEK